MPEHIRISQQKMLFEQINRYETEEKKQSLKKFQTDFDKIDEGLTIEERIRRSMESQNDQMAESLH